MKTKRRGCICECFPDREGIEWDICLCDCKCKAHRESLTISNEEIEKKKELMKFLKKKKEQKSKILDIEV